MSRRWRDGLGFSRPVALMTPSIDLIYFNFDAVSPHLFYLHSRRVVTKGPLNLLFHILYFKVIRDSLFFFSTMD